jgi:concentrative nucleoside transporter, CNT family
MERAVSLLGLFVMLGLAWLLSENKKKMDWRCIISGVVLQFIFAVVVLRSPPGKWFFMKTSAIISKLISFSDAGAAMVFGDGFKEHLFAFSVLPTIIFVSSTMAILFHLGVMQKVVKAMAWVMVKLMNISGAESLAASANVFIGQTEAPLVVKPYLQLMTRSELMAMMTGGMATIAGGVMAAYVSFGIDAGHLLTASILSAPASLLIAKIMIPETGDPVTRGTIRVEIPRTDVNVLDAACRGASEGVQLAINVGGMLIAFVALTALINYLFAFLPRVAGSPLSAERILGWVNAPIAWCMGVEWKDAPVVGRLLGERMFLNEFMAYYHLKDLTTAISPRSFTIATYALCGFANFASIAIQIGGIGSLVPTRRKEFAQIGLRAMIGGLLASYMTATIAGVLID